MTFFEANISKSFPPVFVSQIEHLSIRHLIEPLQGLSFVLFARLLETTSHHINELAFDLSDIIDGNLLTHELLPDDTRQIEDHFGTCSDAHSHENTQEVVETHVLRVHLCRVQHKLFFALLFVIGLITAGT